jgi:GDP-mannose 4,6-dehydratase
MKYLVTGITGFAGPHLAKLLLSKGHDVFGLIRGSNGRQMDLLDIMTDQEITAVHWLFADLLDYAALRETMNNHVFDGVFHLAAQSHPPTSFDRPVLTFNTNVMGSVNLIDCIAKCQPPDCRFGFCSTSEVYGDQSDKLTEHTPLRPINPYAVSKAAVDLYVQERIRNGFLKGFITRAFSHTGPRRGYVFSISSDAYQIAKMMLGLQDKTLLVGNLTTERIVMDVRDCVRAYYLLMQANCRGVFNVCGKHVLPMECYTNLLIELSGLAGVKTKLHKPFYRPVDIAVQKGDCSKLIL